MRTTRRRRILALLLILVSAVLTACGPRPVMTPDDQTAGVDLSQATLEEMNVQHLEAAKGKLTVTQKVSDPFLLGLIGKELQLLQPATSAPQRAAEALLTLTLNDDSGQHVLDCPYVQEMAPPEQAWLSVDGVWHDVPFGLKNLIRAVSYFRVSEGGVDSGDQEFLQRYGWTAAFPLNRLTVRLPEQLTYRVGDYPEAIYWAYNHELSKSIGLNLTPYLGQEVTVRLYKIVEELPEFMTPQRPSGRAIILRQGERIIGAWLDAGRSGWACSLQGKSWEMVTGRSFETWVADLLQRDDPEVIRLAALTPEEVVLAYYAAVDSHDAAASRLYRGIKSLRQDMFMNMDNSLLYNPVVTAITVCPATDGTNCPGVDGTVVLQSGFLGKQLFRVTGCEFRVSVPEGGFIAFVLPKLQRFVLRGGPALGAAQFGIESHRALRSSPDVALSSLWARA